MEKWCISNRELIAGLAGFLMMIALAAGFGYFFGRYDQVQKNKAALEVIPDVNCGAAKPALH